jgi:hypothetical protein
LFTGETSDTILSLSPDVFVPRHSVKDLVITPEETDTQRDKEQQKQAKPSSSAFPEPLQHPHTQSPIATPSSININGDTKDSHKEKQNEKETEKDKEVGGLSRPFAKRGNVSPQTYTHIVSPNPHAPKLTLPEHYARPHLSELQSMTDEELSHVSNFTVGHNRDGSVVWLGETDCRNLDLDAIVHFEPRAVTVYPEQGPVPKPPIGQGLNRPAIVTLTGCWPKASGSTVMKKDPSSLDTYRRKLVTTCTKMGAKFRSYDPDTGEWIFEVEHFSRYGLADDDEEEEEQEQEQEQQKPDHRPGEEQGQRQQTHLQAQVQMQQPLEQQGHLPNLMGRQHTISPVEQEAQEGEEGRPHVLSLVSPEPATTAPPQPTPYHYHPSPRLTIPPARRHMMQSLFVDEEPEDRRARLFEPVHIAKPPPSNVIVPPTPHGLAPVPTPAIATPLVPG